MEEKEVIIKGNKEKIVVSLPKEEIESNTLELLLDDTIDLKEVVKEVVEGNEK